VTMSLFRVAGLTGTLTLVVLSLLPGSERPHTGLPGQLEHVIAYCATAVFLGLGYSTARARVGVVLFLALLAARWSWRSTGFLVVTLSSSILSRARPERVWVS
jgi:hypothetical protein